MGLSLSLMAGRLCWQRGGQVSLAELEMAADSNDKCRFQLLSSTGSSSSGPIIAARATYAHSLNDVDDKYLYMPVPVGMSPHYLYHATFAEHIPSIMTAGLIPGGVRHPSHAASSGHDDVGPKQSEWRSHVFFSPVPRGHPFFY